MEQRTAHTLDTNWNDPTLNREARTRFDRPDPFDLTAIGAMLREARGERGTSMDGVAEELFVKKSTLIAIESGLWDDLPHPVYVKGYVRSYASFLGISDAVEEKLSARPDVKGVDSIVRDDAHGKRPRGESREQHPKGKRHRSLLPTVGLISSTVVAILVGIALSSGLLAGSSVNFRELIAGCHQVVADLRRIILP